MNTTTHTTAPIPFSLILTKADQIQTALDRAENGIAYVDRNPLTKAAIAFLEDAGAAFLRNPHEGALYTVEKI